MLIESTRDSLCFTVTHYKHSKQQYSIQVRGGRGRGLGLGTHLPPHALSCAEPRGLPLEGRSHCGHLSGLCQRVEVISQKPVPPLPCSAHVLCPRACDNPWPPLPWLLPGQNSGGETDLDSPHQEAHSGEPPHHHPTEGALLGPHPSSRWGAGRGCPPEPAVGVHQGLVLWTLTPLSSWGQFRALWVSSRSKSESVRGGGTHPARS